jgi:hypothetical protein
MPNQKMPNQKMPNQKMPVRDTRGPTDPKPGKSCEMLPEKRAGS